MKLFLPSFLVTLILINSCTSQSDKNFKKFTLQGEIIGQGTGKIVLQYVLNDAEEGSISSQISLVKLGMRY